MSKSKFDDTIRDTIYGVSMAWKPGIIDVIHDTAAAAALPLYYMCVYWHAD
jgi:hypothetical protein